MSAKNPKRPVAVDDRPAEALPSDEVLAELGALMKAILPADVAEDWHLGAALYLETHPQMYERLQAIRARAQEASGAVPTVKVAGSETKRARRK